MQLAALKIIYSENQKLSYYSFFYDHDRVYIMIHSNPNVFYYCRKRVHEYIIIASLVLLASFSCHPDC